MSLIRKFKANRAARLAREAAFAASMQAMSAAFEI